MAEVTNKYGATRTWSELCQRTFDSKAEAIRGEELWALQAAGEIADLEYQPIYTLSVSPKVTYTADFRYRIQTGDEWEWIVEDVKGMVSRDTRTRLVWLWKDSDKTTRVRLLRRTDDGWEQLRSPGYDGVATLSTMHGGQEIAGNPYDAH